MDLSEDPPKPARPVEEEEDNEEDDGVLTPSRVLASLNSVLGEVGGKAVLKKQLPNGILVEA